MPPRMITTRQTQFPCSVFDFPHSTLRRGFTLAEMLLTIAILVIVFGVMVDLARYVRNRSAGEFTRRLLADLDQAMVRYKNRYLSGPSATLLLPERASEWPGDDALRVRAEANSGQWVRAFRNAGELGEGVFGGLPLNVYDATLVRDAWGKPVILMNKGRADIGMAPGDSEFFFSAGPDRNYRTREDNLYSYEVVMSR